MEQKKTKFSPSNIDELEQAIVNQLIGLREGNRYTVPEEFRTRDQTAWESLLQAFPVPASINMQSIQQRFSEQKHQAIIDCGKNLSSPA